jgi:hypothetical protein
LAFLRVLKPELVESIYPASVLYDSLHWLYLGPQECDTRQPNITHSRAGEVSSSNE